MLDVKKLRIGDLVCLKFKQWGINFSIAGEITYVDCLNNRYLTIKGFKWNKGVLIQKEEERMYCSHIVNSRRISPMELMRFERLYKIQCTTKEKAREIFNAWT